MKKDPQMTVPNTNLQDQVIKIRHLKLESLLFNLGKWPSGIYAILVVGWQTAKAGKRSVIRLVID